MFGLPMEIVGPVLGMGTIIGFITAAIITIRVVSSRFPRGANRPGQLDPATREALEEVQARVGELEEVKQRMTELEERLDFTERLLANRQWEPRLGPGGPDQPAGDGDRRTEEEEVPNPPGRDRSYGS